MIVKNISGKNFLFTTDAIIDTDLFSHDSIKLSDDNKVKLKKEKKKFLN